MMDETVKCPHCGTVNLPGSKRCRLCGKEMSHEHTRLPGSLVCPNCGQVVEQGAELCNSCQMPAREIIMRNLPKEVSEAECVHWSEKPAAAGRSARLAMAGILIMIAGALGIGQSVIALSPDLSESFLDAIESAVPWSAAIDDWVAEYVVLQAWVFIAGLVAIAGGVFALTGSRYDMSLIGGAFGVMAIGFFMGAFLGLVGLLLVAASRKEFLPECG